ncbi:hypothetical protein A2870_00570 [Candidatus Curtissbacteria bacterium RIFCSPHIGHO2_01_FULL_41_11]|uniref:Uncharacterized protein n=1 Tax=Candidatus Curtissbacteria bacterium RIFCSPHIGHO2_01_FULL_41_11 TaxID=1797711 RepID=A0A1F5G3D6_9BACT|nr:MAG: hypothetical protein A2870_00570 [Candidatus Curtissbacteria bacterium RIFCSPHIGHO2_01_FULL_41_11]
MLNRAQNIVAESDNFSTVKMGKTILVSNSTFLPSYNFEEARLLLEPKLTATTRIIKGIFQKSLVGQIFLLLSSNPNKTTSNAFERR